MKQMLKEIQDGEFARKWVGEHRAGRPWFNATRAQERDQVLERVGAELRKMMPFVSPVTAPDQTATATR
jgi:ketol-acid reductoisomerase